MVDPKTAEGPRALAFGPAVKVTEKDGKPIGNKGHNGHPFDGQYCQTSNYIRGIC